MGERLTKTETQERKDKVKGERVLFLKNICGRLYGGSQQPDPPPRAEIQQWSSMGGGNQETLSSPPRSFLSLVTGAHHKPEKAKGNGGGRKTGSMYRGRRGAEPGTSDSARREWLTLH